MACRMFVAGLVSTLCAVTVVARSSSDSQARQAGPSVTIQNGTIIGSSSLGIDSFKGIPFAQPPTGSLRLRPPQPIQTSFGCVYEKRFLEIL